MQGPNGGLEEPSRPKKGGGAKVVAAAVALILVVLLLATPWFWAFVGNLIGPTYRYDASADFTVTRTITVTASGPGTMDITIDLPLPREIRDGSGNVLQEVRSVDPRPTPLDDPKYGGDWMTWDKSGVSSYTVTIAYSFHAKTVWWDVTKDNSAGADAIPQGIAQRYGGAEWKIDPGIAEIRTLAGDLARSQGNVYGKLRAIYDYMSQNIQYQTTRIPEPKEPLATLRDRTGDCDDQSILFCSLARAAGIPAWMEFGALYDPSRATWGGHAWVKTYVPMADGTGGTVNIDVVNKEFLLRSCNRFADWESDGNGTHMQDYYNTLTYRAGSRVSVDYSEDYSGSYAPSSDKVYVPAGGRPATPGLDAIAIVATVAVLAVACRRLYKAR